MVRPDVARRLACFGVGLVLSGLGVAMSTCAGLGTTPISSVPYVLTFIVPFSFGLWTLIINIFLFFGQIFILKRNFRKTQVFQLVAVSVFGVFIDVGMYLSSFYVPEAYWQQLVELFIGCFILAGGIACEVVADVLYLPGEGFVKAVCSTFRYEFGCVKIGFDVSLVLIAIAISLAATWHILGLREGTIIAAFCVGWMTRFLLRRMHFVRSWCQA